MLRIAVCIVVVDVNLLGGMRVSLPAAACRVPVAQMLAARRWALWPAGRARASCSYPPCCAPHRVCPASCRVRYAWDVPLDVGSFICLAMAVGLSVDYVVHLAHAYECAHGEPAQRMQAAIGEIGGAPRPADPSHTPPPQSAH